MKLKTSGRTKTVGIIFLALALFCVGLAIMACVSKGEKWTTNCILMLICAVLWIVCGIIVLKTANRQKQGEAKK